jgi:hypothetical protein
VITLAQKMERRNAFKILESNRWRSSFLCMGLHMTSTTCGWIFLGLLGVPAAAQNIEWYRQFSHTGAAGQAYGVAAVSGSIYVASISNGPVLWKYDQAGNQIWERDLEPGKVSGDAGFAVAADAAGAYIVGFSNGIPGQPQIFNNDALPAWFPRAPSSSTWWFQRRCRMARIRWWRRSTG